MERNETNDIQLLSPEESEGAPADVPSFEEEFSGRRRGPDLKLPLGLLITFLLIGGVGFFLWRYLAEGPSGGTLILNEICTANHESLVSETLDTPDWVELYNGSNRDLNLKDYGLTDNPKQSYKYRLPDVTLEAGEYLLVYFTGMGWWAALAADIGLALAYVLYAFFFNWGYDRAFPIAQDESA